MNIDLLINGQKEALGIRLDKMYVSWIYPQQIASFKQAAYRLWITKGLENETTPAFWDSGWIESKENLYMPCTATNLPCMTTLYARLSVRSIDGAILHSRPSRFVLAPDTWQAKWIWKPDLYITNDIAAFQKTFHIEDTVLDATINVSAHSQYKLWINGIAVGGYVTPAPSDAQNQKLYLSYYIKPYLSRGENKIQAIVLYQGGGGQNYVDGIPGFFCECHIKTAKDDVLLLTDETWQATDHTPYKPGMPFQQNRSITAIEHYDASFAKGDKWWDLVEWTDAVLSPSYFELEGLTRQQIPEGIVERSITPLSLSYKEGVQVFDAGCIVTGWPKLRVDEAEGSVLSIRYSEDLTEEGRVKHNVANEHSEHYLDIYTVGKDKDEEWSPDFSYKAFRYLEVSGLTKALEFGALQVELAHTAIPQTGHFSSDHKLLNQIYDACIQTQKNNMQGLLSDCPHREQAQYLADADMQAETLMYFFDSKDMVEKVLMDFVQAQQVDGTFPFVYPANYEEERFSLRIPEWDLHFCTLLWKLYYQTGNIAYLEQYIEPCILMMDHYLGQLDSEIGLVPKSKFWHISDWPYPKVDHEGAYLAAQNIKIYHNLKLMVQMLERLGDELASMKYKELADLMYTSIRQHLLDTKTGLFRDSSDSASYATGVNALACCYGLFKTSEIPVVLKHIRQLPLKSSTLLTLNVIRALFLHGEGDKAFAILSREEEPGWGAMVKKGYGTIWEGFSDIESHCHAWNAYPARLYAEYLVGIRLAKAGFNLVELKPYFPEGIEHLEASVHTPQGILAAKWTIRHGQLRLDLDVPYGIEVDVYLPDSTTDADTTHRYINRLQSGTHRLVFKWE